MWPLTQHRVFRIGPRCSRCLSFRSFSWPSNVPGIGWTTFCIHVPRGWAHGSFPPLAVVGGAAGVMCVQGLCLSSCFSAFSPYLRPGLLGPVVLCGALWEPAHFLPTAAEPSVSSPEMSADARPDFWAQSWANYLRFGGRVKGRKDTGHWRVISSWCWS